MALTTGVRVGAGSSARLHGKYDVLATYYFVCAVKDTNYLDEQQI